MSKITRLGQLEMSKCKCQDSYGHVCGEVMTSAEEAQDGMCDSCASHVTNYFNCTGKVEYVWSNTKQITGESHV